MYRFLLSLHLIAVISWMAGILYLLRLFVYHAEETESIVKRRFEIMEERASKIILMPAMGMAIFFGVAMLGLEPNLLSQGWLHGKLLLVLVLMILSVRSVRLRRALKEGQSFNSNRLRVLNEVPTLLMILIIFLVILKPF